MPVARRPECTERAPPWEWQREPSRRSGLLPRCRLAAHGAGSSGNGSATKCPALDLWREFNTRFPYLDENRDRWIHATDRIVNHSYFADDNALDAAADHPHR